MRLDLHVHSRYSPDARGDAWEIAHAAKSRYLDGVAIVDHNRLEGSLKAIAEIASGGDFLIIRGAEITSLQGHVLGLGIGEEVEKGQSAVETVEKIKALGGIAIAPHPYRFWSGLGEPVVKSVPFMAVEAHNGRSIGRHNQEARKLTTELRLPATAGSDAHAPGEVGRAFVEVEGDGLREDDVIRALLKGEAKVSGVNRRPTQTVRYTSKCVGEWLLRGMRRI